MIFIHFCFSKKYEDVYYSLISLNDHIKEYVGMLVPGVQTVLMHSLNRPRPRPHSLSADHYHKQSLHFNNMIKTANFGKKRKYEMWPYHAAKNFSDDKVHLKDECYASMAFDIFNIFIVNMFRV